MSYEAVDMIKAVERASRNTQGPYSVQASPLLQAMRSESVPAFPLGGGNRGSVFNLKRIDIGVRYSFQGY
jgi:hypothetical protein